jgi:predicted transcriptional regulator
MTVLDNLHQKGWVRREAEGRAYRYEAVSTRAAYSAALMNDAWSQSDNPAAALVAFFGMMSEEQRVALRDAVRIAQGPEPQVSEPVERPSAPGPSEENPAADGDASGR